MDPRAKKIALVVVIAVVLLLVGAHDALHQDADGCPMCSVHVMEAPVQLVVPWPALVDERLAVGEERLVLVEREAARAPRAPPVAG